MYILVRLFLLCELYIKKSFFIHLKKYFKALECQNLRIHVIMIKSYLKFFLLGKPHLKNKFVNSRYEILMVSMAPPEGEEERSQAYYVIKVCVKPSK